MKALHVTEIDLIDMCKVLLKEDYMKSKGECYTGLFFGIIWLLMVVLIFVLYQTGSLGTSFSVPRFIGWLYDIVGVLIASIIQFVLSRALIITSVKALKSLKKTAL